MYFKILGPLEVEDRGRRLEVGGAKQRALLTILLLRANETVSRDVLIDELWGARPPAGAGHGLETHVSRLRKILHGNGREVILTRPTGYLLRLDGDETDLGRFERLVEEGYEALQAGDHGPAATALQRALSLWRGRPLDDVAFESFAQVEIGRLDDRYATAAEWLYEAELAQGRHAEVVDELNALVRRYPLRERLQALLMLSLYRSGRQAEALDVYAQARRDLVQELGLEPGAELRELEQKILRHDASLRHGQPSERLDSVHPSRTRPSGRVLAGVIAGVVAGAVAIAIFAFASGRGGGGLSRISANSVGVLDTSRNRLSHEVAVGVDPSAIAASTGAVWVANADGHSVSRIDPRTDTVNQTIQVGDSPSGIAVGRGAIWVANALAGTVTRIDPTTNQPVDTITVGSDPSGIASGAGAVWVSNAGDDTITKIGSAGKTETFRLAGGADSIAAGFGALWVMSASSDSVSRIDPKTSEMLTSISVGHGPSAVAVGANGVWVANGLDDTVMKIDPSSNAVEQTIPVGGGPSGIAFDGHSVWVANEFAGTLSRIDPARGRVARTIKVGNRPGGLAVTKGTLYVAVRAGAGAHRGGTIRYLLPPEVRPDLRRLVDPSVNNLFSGEAYDSLVEFRRMGGAAGAEIVPDLASAMPSVTDGGKTYTFQVRRGIRYSNGELVKPEDFRYGLERAFKLKSFFAGYLAGIIGGQRCLQRPRTCNLFKGVATDDGSYVLSFHLAAPDPEFLDKLALTSAVPVPVGWPLDGSGKQVPPTTAATMLASATPTQLVFVRNPDFHEWSQAARPDRYTDEEIVRVAGVEKALKAVEQGEADVAAAYDLSTVSRAALARIKTQYGGQAHFNPLPWTIYLTLHTKVPPFNDVRVRRALNYAIDRRRVVKLWGGPDTARVTCQVLPPNFPGYQRYCPYTVNPNPRGTWSAPDLVKARRLIRASGTRGMSIVMWSRAAGYPGGRQITDYVASVLRSLGYRVRLRFIAVEASPAVGWQNRRHVQLNLQDWYADYPAASNFINSQLSCSHIRFSPLAPFNLAEFCDRRVDGQIRKALLLDESDPSAANGLWTRIDHEIVDQAPWVPLLNPQSFDLVSKRVGNYEYSPEWGGLSDQLWVR